MAELADAADLKSAGLKKLVGVRVPLSAPKPGREDPFDDNLNVMLAESLRSFLAREQIAA